jgi:hypothetical protein
LKIQDVFLIEIFIFTGSSLDTMFLKVFPGGSLMPTNRNMFPHLDNIHSSLIVVVVAVFPCGGLARTVLKSKFCFKPYKMQFCTRSTDDYIIKHLVPDDVIFFRGVSYWLDIDIDIWVFKF